MLKYVTWKNNAFLELEFQILKGSTYVNEIARNQSLTIEGKGRNTITIQGFSKGWSWLISHFLQVAMYVLITSMGLEWHVYFLLVNLTKLTYLIICQIKHLVKMDNGVFVKWEIFCYLIGQDNY
jgi:hypothetical protein